MHCSSFMIMAVSNRIARRLLPLLVCLLAWPQQMLLLGTADADDDTAADGNNNNDDDHLVRVSAWVQKQLGGDPEDGRVVQVEWDPRTEDVDAVARAFVRQTFSVAPAATRRAKWPRDRWRLRCGTRRRAAARRIEQQQQQQQQQQEGEGEEEEEEEEEE